MSQDVTELERRLEEQDKKLKCAAEFGKQLLDTNNSLSLDLENTTRDLTDKIEVTSPSHNH